MYGSVKYLKERKREREREGEGEREYSSCRGTRTWNEDKKSWFACKLFFSFRFYTDLLTIFQFNPQQEAPLRHCHSS